MGMVLRRSDRRRSGWANHAAKGADTTPCLNWRIGLKSQLLRRMEAPGPYMPASRIGGYGTCLLPEPLVFLFVSPGFQECSGRRRRKKGDQRFRGVHLGAGSANTRSKLRVVLDCKWQWADRINIRGGEIFANLVEPDFYVTACNAVIEVRTGIGQLGFLLHF